LYVYNLHLDHVSQPSREKSVAALVEKIRRRTPIDPVVVMGDFNAGEQNPAIRFLKGERSLAAVTRPMLFVDSFRSLHPTDSAAGTFHAFRGERGGEKIDHIFVEPQAVVLDAAILHTETDGRYPSDHFPVTARIRIP
jgi:endonuclease/exonuclease/phosphatase family metal-dependent hydrolase